MALTVNIKTRSGPIEGLEEKSSFGHKYLAFRGIRYAEPPGRFEEALEVKEWTAVKDAKEYGSPACQFDAFSNVYKGDEDCLFLNVYTRAKNGADKLPVIVYIHGGGYVFGSGDDGLYGPTFAMDREMVLVAINYRLGVFGFMPPMDGLFPANIGLKDQRLALQWIKKNVACFGGDPDNITLMGESAGSGSVFQQYLHPSTETEGLFHKIIAQSGSPLGSWAHITKDQSQVLMSKFMKALFKDETVPKEQLKDRLMKMEPKILVNTLESLKHETLFSMVPFYDNQTEEDAFTTTSNPFQEIKKDLQRKLDVPSLIQVNDAEAAMFIPLAATDGKMSVEKRLRDLCDHYNCKYEDVWKMYFGTEDCPSELGKHLSQNGKKASLLTDIFMYAPIYLHYKSHCQKNTTFFMRYSHPSPTNSLPYLMSGGKFTERLGASHLDETILMFQSKVL